MWWLVSFKMSRISLKSVVDSCGPSIAIHISPARFTSFSLERSLVFTIFIWLKERSTVAVPTGNVNGMSRSLKLFGKIVGYVFPDNDALKKNFDRCLYDLWPTGQRSYRQFPPRKNSVWNPAVYVRMGTFKSLKSLKRFKRRQCRVSPTGR